MMRAALAVALCLACVAHAAAADAPAPAPATPAIAGLSVTNEVRLCKQPPSQGGSVIPAHPGL